MSKRTELDDPTPETISPEVPTTLDDVTSPSEPNAEREERLGKHGETLSPDDAVSSLPPDESAEGPEHVEQSHAYAPEGDHDDAPILDFGPYEPVPDVQAHEQPTWPQRFIAALRISPVVGTAARVAGRGRTSVYDLKGKDKLFAAAWTSALEDGADRLEQAVLERAVTGVENVYETYDPKTGALKTRRVVRVFNDRGAEFMLKALRPEKYRERFEVRNTDETSIDSDIRQLDEEMRNLAKGAPVPNE